MASDLKNGEIKIRNMVVETRLKIRNDKITRTLLFPMFINIKCFRFVKQIHLDKF
jgi:hypothetical protein